MNKYHAKKTIIDGITFHSKKEANHYAELKLCMRAKGDDKVIGLEVQPKFLLQEGFTDNDGVKHRPIYYIADFKIKYADGKEVIEDVKASKKFTTGVYKLKKKMLLHRYKDIVFREVY